MRSPGIDLRRGQNPGLLLQRFLSQDDDEEKRRLMGAALRSAGDPEVLAIYGRAYERWQGSFPELTAANTFQTEGRVVVGLGSESVLETGLRLHHTYGLPLLPGSALKGLAAHYCNQVWGAINPDFKRIEKMKNYHSLLFGTTDESGVVVFHDAWFVPGLEKQPLRLDVMTPHHPGWVDGTSPPTDFDSPIPVPFVSVVGSFRVAVTWRGPEHPLAATWTELAFDLLVRALAEWGVGGKTTSGYGRLVEVDEKKRRLPGLVRVGSLVEATLKEKPKPNKPWRATYAPTTGEPLSGQIDGTPQAGIADGHVVRLVVAEIGKKLIKFRWPLPHER